MDKQATAAGLADPDKFAEPFANAKLKSSDLDLLRKEAKALDNDLRKQDAKAKAVVTAFREQAKKAAQAGQALPSAPPEIHQLEAERTAIIVQHMTDVQRHLGPERKAQLESHLTREFAPHISLKVLAHPSSGAPAGTKRQTFTSAQ